MLPSTIIHIKDFLEADVIKTQEKYDFYKNLLHHQYGDWFTDCVSESELKDLNSYRDAMILSRNSYQDFCNHQF